MKKEQVKLLLDLAKKLNERQRNKEDSIESLCAAGILTSNGDFSNNYPYLNKLYPKNTI